MTTAKLYRININMSTTETSLMSMLGRYAHIQFLENPQLV